MSNISTSVSLGKYQSSFTDCFAGQVWQYSETGWFYWVPPATEAPLLQHVQRHVKDGHLHPTTLPQAPEKREMCWYQRWVDARRASLPHSSQLKTKTKRKQKPTHQFPEAGNNINLLKDVPLQRGQTDPKPSWHPPPARQEGWCAPTLRRKAHTICMRKLFFHCNIWIYSTNGSKSVNSI